MNFSHGVVRVPVGNEYDTDTLRHSIGGTPRRINDLRVFRRLACCQDGSQRKVKMANSMARCAAKRSASSSGGGLSISRLSRASSRPRAVARPWSLRFAGVAPVTQREAGLQGVLHLTDPPAVGMVLQQMLTPSKQVLQTRLVFAVGVTAVDHPPVAHEHAVEVGPQDRLGVVESAARADGVDGRRRGNGRPQPVADGADAPTGLIGRDHGSVAGPARATPRRPAARRGPHDAADAGGPPASLAGRSGSAAGRRP